MADKNKTLEENHQDTIDEAVKLLKNDNDIMENCVVISRLHQLHGYLESQKQINHFKNDLGGF